MISIGKSVVAKAVPFDNTGVSYAASDVQAAIAEVRTRVVTDLTSTATTLNGTLTLTQSSNSCQFLTGTATGFTINLPDATTLFTGRRFEIFNTSSRTVTIKDGSGATLTTLGQTSIGFLTLQTNGTTAGGWQAWQTYVANGIVNYLLTSTTTFTTTSSTDVVITSFTQTPTAGTYACYYNAANTYTSNARYNFWSFYKAGSQIADSERKISSSASNQGMVQSTTTITTLDGSQAIDVRVRCDTGGGSLSVNTRAMVLLRLGN